MSRIHGRQNGRSYAQHLPTRVKRLGLKTLRRLQPRNLKLSQDVTTSRKPGRALFLPLQVMRSQLLKLTRRIRNGLCVDSLNSSRSEMRYAMVWSSAWKMFNSFALQHFLCIRHRPALMPPSLLSLLGMLSLSAPALELRMRHLGASALDSRRRRMRSWQI